MKSPKKMQEMINKFNLEDHPDNIPKNIENMKCPYFGHLCPVYFCKEELE